MQLLISIARFDTDGNTEVSAEEFNKSTYAGTICVANSIAGVQGFNLIACLMFLATHLSSIGRPRGFKATPAAIDVLGEDETAIFMSLVYSLNILAETLALSIMINSVFMRQLLSNSLPSVNHRPTELSSPSALCLIPPPVHLPPRTAGHEPARLPSRHEHCFRDCNIDHLDACRGPLGRCPRRALHAKSGCLHRSGFSRHRSG